MAARKQKQKQRRMSAQVVERTTSCAMRSSRGSTWRTVKPDVAGALAGIRGGAEGGRGADGLDGGHLRLLAHLVRGAGGGAGLAVQLVNSSQARNLPARKKRPWIARLTEIRGCCGPRCTRRRSGRCWGCTPRAHLRPDRGPHEVLAAAEEAAGVADRPCASCVVSKCGGPGHSYGRVPAPRLALEGVCLGPAAHTRLLARRSQRPAWKPAFRGTGREAPRSSRPLDRLDEIPRTATPTLSGSPSWPPTPRRTRTRSSGSASPLLPEAGEKAVGRSILISSGTC